jgi:hypothetical protein
MISDLLQLVPEYSSLQVSFLSTIQLPPNAGVSFFKNNEKIYTEGYDKSFKEQ